MSELSWIWNCGTGDGTEYPSGVPIEVMASTYSILGNLNPSDSGVVYWTDTNVDALQLSGITNAPTGLLNATESGGIGFSEGFGGGGFAPDATSTQINNSSSTTNNTTNVNFTGNYASTPTVTDQSSLVAIVAGWLYVSDTTVDFDINGSPGAANATDIIDRS